MNWLKGYLLVLIFSFNMVGSALADEGMWIPLLLDQARYERMKQMGCQLTPEDIYSVNHASIKDAVVLFGRGCTGVMVSNEGLLLTNHHCGQSAIQSHSSLEHDYLTNGFWAGDKAHELANPSLSVSFLVRMEDVTKRVLRDVPSTISESERTNLIQSILERIVASEAKKSPGHRFSLKPLYNGNQYFLYEYEVFTDVRLVGAPPSGIGKFGGDTDNWMWPRHTGDFSIFRVYANKDNKPAPYSADNVPYQPKKFLPVSIKGVNENDFTMVYGYPGSTQQFMTSQELEFLLKTNLPSKIDLRTRRLDIMAKAMDSDAAVRIQYAAKYAGISNSWKKWQGAVHGLNRADAITVKKLREVEFQEWTNRNDTLKVKYGGLLDEFKRIYPVYEKYSFISDYFGETAMAVELLDQAAKFYNFSNNASWKDTTKLRQETRNYSNAINGFFRNYYRPIDKKVFSSMLLAYYMNVPPQYHPAIFKKLESKYKGDFDRWADDVYRKSVFCDKDKMVEVMQKFSPSSLKKIRKDPAMEIYLSFADVLNGSIIGPYNKLSTQVDSLYRIYTAGIMLMKKDKFLYPEANLTLRLAFGKVEGYEASDAIDYSWYTTSEGVMQKDNPSVYDYRVPLKLKELCGKKDFGRYAAQDGKLHVCFIASNHTSGGNSGSPVINGKGELIGLNFDRNWEGTMSDMLYDPNQCRNIVLDTRYMLFIIDKYAGAGYLLDEMKVVL
jgi:hypothetical protein